MIKFITGRKSAWVTLLIGLIFAILAFGPLRAASTETSPGVGLPADTESVVVDELISTLPGSDSTAAVIVYAADSKLNDEQVTWLQGSFDPMAQMLVGGANEKFVEFSNLEVNGSKFVPPAAISEDSTTAVITVPMEQTDATEEIVDACRKTS
jgi:putative drug exporter of the RND superfamily